MNSVDKVNKLSKSDFISIFGNVFEKTEWIAEKAYNSKPYKNFEELFLKMLKIFENSEKESHLEILNAHPDLAIEKKLTKDSRNEQENASLNECFEEEFKEFKKLNEEYKKKFLDIAFQSNKWRKWMIPNSNASQNDKAIISGHYVFSHPEFITMKNHMLDNMDDHKKLDLFLKQEIEQAILRYIKCLNLI